MVPTSLQEGNGEVSSSLEVVTGDALLESLGIDEDRSNLVENGQFEKATFISAQSDT